MYGYEHTAKEKFNRYSTPGYSKPGSFGCATKRKNVLHSLDLQNKLSTAKDFQIPKKPEPPKEQPQIAATGRVGDSQNIQNKELGWKTLTPTIDIKTAEITPEKKNEIKKPSPKPDLEDLSSVENIRTYKKDVAGAIKNQKTSLVRMVLEEQRVRQAKETNESPKSRKNLPLILFSLVFLMLSSGIIYYAFFRPITDSAILAGLKITPLIQTEKMKEIDVTGKTIKQLTSLVQSSSDANSLKLDTLEYIYFVEDYTTQSASGPIVSKKIIGVDKLFEALGIIAPADFLRSLQSDYMFGIHNFVKGQKFLVLKTDYYDTAFAGMLNWESTLLKDIYPLFGVKPNEDLGGRSWVDVVTKNKDTRVLKDFNNQTVLVYMFKDQNTLIISTSEGTLFEISNRIDLLREKK